MDGGAWWATVHRVTELDKTERLHFHFSLIKGMLLERTGKVPGTEMCRSGKKMGFER